MAKITKREYNSLRTGLQAEIIRVKNRLEILDRWSDSLDWDDVKVEDIKKIDKIGDYWNSLHDKQRELEKELDFLEDRWDRRNWTGSDWNSWELVANNID